MTSLTHEQLADAVARIISSPWLTFTPHEHDEMRKVIRQLWAERTSLPPLNSDLEQTIEQQRVAMEQARDALLMQRDNNFHKLCWAENFNALQKALAALDAALGSQGDISNKKCSETAFPTGNDCQGENRCKDVCEANSPRPSVGEDCLIRLIRPHISISDIEFEGDGGDKCAEDIARALIEKGIINA